MMQRKRQCSFLIHQQTLLFALFLKATICGFPYNLLSVSSGVISYQETKHGSCVGLEIRPQSAFTALRRALLPDATYFADDLVMYRNLLQIMMAV
jgi:hypothetical protein